MTVQGTFSAVLHAQVFETFQLRSLGHSMPRLNYIVKQPVVDSMP